MVTTHWNRRAFIARAATAALMAAPALRLVAAEKAKSAKTLIGSNIYGWTQYAQREKRTLDVGEVISALQEAGYDYLENFMNLAQPEENARFAEQLRKAGMQPVSLYTGGAMHQAPAADATVASILAAAKVCKEAGFSVISCNPNPIGREKSDEELKTQLDAVKKLATGLRALGLQIGLHHHMPEMANGAREFHYMFRNSDPKLVGFCYDVHWVWKGGVKPADALKEYGNRVVTWHLRQSREGIWYEVLDSGDIDYQAVATYAREHNLPGRFTVELALEAGTKVTRTAAENHRISRQWVSKVFSA